jgi:hypothetical protein
VVQPRRPARGGRIADDQGTQGTVLVERGRTRMWDRAALQQHHAMPGPYAPDRGEQPGDSRADHHDP